ncbi:hypothetical protein BDP27DRAFT_1319862 [Rhodocollybia butyracea]|uniref:Uncharacterized protein n=1 Tax=Rhodocollybia butyracea TaxID=206335 RepID=A0A9P5UA62_9AGAR|nr:hypothetical protein BDP27DRAFT_1319862 [Rhodocollybia butyracea]
MLITHIHYFAGLVLFAVLISTVHAMPVEVHPRPSTTPESDAPPTKKGKTDSKIYRVTVIHVDDDENSEGFAGIKNMDFKIIATSIGSQVPTIRTRTKKSTTQIITGKLGKQPEDAFLYINSCVTDSGPPAKAIVISVVEGLVNGVPCHGDWPCVLWRRVHKTSRSESAFSSVYQIDPTLKDEHPKRIEIEVIGRVSRNRKVDGQYDEEFWASFPRKKFEEQWPDLKKALDTYQNTPRPNKAKTLPNGMGPLVT